ncbi:TIGR04282 family arsenosugar biosynthesis glycosyltransferase [Marinimicrobium alkaliphilum]|uniref:TIGR04282 family arsenosugar biosynthesis glycosyltransferase n=1 Tax=Marinimicrobium alkaliphilum TaxID=2202654 RepID=UPI000DB9D7A8|nr:TIGR04282 family arsenosugar biosynthesis glycosyltransferase [Marinimicrobium alkaliphilum]
MRITLSILAKAPVPGYAKTRLIPVLGPEGAAQVARQLLDQTLTAAADARISERRLWVAPAYADPGWRSVEIPDGFTLSDQGEGDLGERLARVTQQSLSGSDGVLLSGTDCVDSRASLFEQAAGHLRDHDAVLYPAADGGYALLGLRQYHPSLFSDMPWSTAEVGAITLARIRALGWSCYRGAVLNDIDEPADLVFLDKAQDTS